MLKTALLINLMIVLCELYTLGHIRSKRNILKYYTYLQNFLALAASLTFSASAIVCMVLGGEIPGFVKGLRYVATCGLLTAAFIFVAFLGAGRNTAITEDDFLQGVPPRTANAILHYLCPVLALVSFVFFERELPAPHDVWTGFAAVPSCIYWMIYIVLSATKQWEEPYHFEPRKGKNRIQEGLPFFLIPVSFMVISFVLWNIQ